MHAEPGPRLRVLLWPLSLVWLLLALSAPAAAGAEELAVPGLFEPVEILHDRWGIAHIYARNEHDLFFAQGYNVAGDRLFQLELWRRQATGTVAEVQGPRALPRNVGVRLLRFRGDMTKELSRYHPRGLEIITAFVQGINAYIECTSRHPELLPIEFQVLGTAPGRWTPEVVVSRHNGLFRNVTQEVQYAQLVHLLGEDRSRELLNLHPGRPRLKADESVDLALIGEKVLSSYTASRAVMRFLPADVLPAFRGKGVAPDRQRDGESTAPQGSNNWVISGDHTFSRHRSWPTTRTGPSSSRRSATGSTWSRPGGT